MSNFFLGPVLGVLFSLVSSDKLNGAAMVVEFLSWLLLLQLLLVGDFYG